MFVAFNIMLNDLSQCSNANTERCTRCAARNIVCEYNWDRFVHFTPPQPVTTTTHHREGVPEVAALPTQDIWGGAASDGILGASSSLNDMAGNNCK
jgi:hypothetical protein